MRLLEYSYYQGVAIDEMAEELQLAYNRIDELEAKLDEVMTNQINSMWGILNTVVVETLNKENKESK
jgi:hypothetical protein